MKLPILRRAQGQLIKSKTFISIRCRIESDRFGDRFGAGCCMGSPFDPDEAQPGLVIVWSRIQRAPETDFWKTTWRGDVLRAGPSLGPRILGGPVLHCCTAHPRRPAGINVHFCPPVEAGANTPTCALAELEQKEGPHKVSLQCWGFVLPMGTVAQLEGRESSASEMFQKRHPCPLQAHHSYCISYIL